ncbi:very-long-chain (3R)-3-hydroxyacyl-CoA dehydratase 4 [Clupea harengus]|uniref:Very-long-chain (3R)-3-hydroxyacyl-CoA dehydratase n=1 Tax=Clupea harengus TaxID=7950 RepID=A0A6P8GSJ0_CLUHA|nr:very-long-chain (3R)-3-hydroxyacyl-CoA dehydratase 4 [Clupea harengus]
MRCSIRLVYLLIYNLLQFSGSTWIFANMTARFLFFGRGAHPDMFYSVGVVMSLCQLLSMLEFFHIADSLEKARLLPRIIQVMERNLLLFVVFVSQEEFQSNPIVCVQFYLWNIAQLLRYPHTLLCLVSSTLSANTLWAHHTFSIPVYVLSVLTEGISIWQALPYFENGMYSIQLTAPVQVFIHFPYVLMAYLPLLAAAAMVTVWLLLKERKQQLDCWNKKLKRK